MERLAVRFNRRRSFSSTSRKATPTETREAIMPVNCARKLTELAEEVAVAAVVLEVLLLLLLGLDGALRGLAQASADCY
jgi:hypothetical protein